jgi:hypothetical protein
MSNGLTMDEKLSVLEELRAAQPWPRSPVSPDPITEAALWAGWLWICDECGEHNPDSVECQSCEEPRYGDPYDDSEYASGMFRAD